MFEAHTLGVTGIERTRVTSTLPQPVTLWVGDGSAVAHPL